MIYTFLSAVFLTLFLVTGFLAGNTFMDLMRRSVPLTWFFYSHAVVLAIIAALMFVLACVFGSLIPQCYAAC